MEASPRLPVPSSTPWTAARHYSADGFWTKLTRGAVTAGREVVEKSLWLYFAAQRPETPKWARATVYAALGYLILPLDAVPDIAPVAGYSDDLGVLVFALATISRYVDDSVRARAAAVLARWFR
jgi:uncharacterized membrane protein YkvA (DUF1232 family)